MTAALTPALHRLCFFFGADLVRGARPAPALAVPKNEEFVSFKSTEIVPAFVNTGKVEDSVALCELYGAMCAAITIPPRGALIFNVDGTF